MTNKATNLIEDLVFLLENSGSYNVNGKCNDCKKDVLISIDPTEDGQIQIEGGAIYKPTEDLGYEDKYIYKCDDCYNKDKILHQVTEVYTRCVGYYRPTKQFNPGKISEFSVRKNFDIVTAEQIF
jgi:hypothetical protein